MLTTTPARTRTVVTVTDPDAPGSRTATIRLDAFEVPRHGVDTDITGPYPVVLVVGGLPTQQVTTLKRNGYAYIAMNTGSVYSDGSNNPHTGAYNEPYPYQAGSYRYDSGTLMGWAWGISRIIDATKNDAEGANRYNLAWNKTAVTGVSRNGKAAALAWRASVPSPRASCSPTAPPRATTGSTPATRPRSGRSATRASRPGSRRRHRTSSPARTVRPAHRRGARRPEAVRRLDG